MSERYNYEAMIRRLKENKVKYKTWQRVMRRLFNIKASRLREIFIYLTVKGYNERYICRLLTIPYKSWRMYISTDLVLKNELKQARKMQVSYKREAQVAKVSSKVTG